MSDGEYRDRPTHVRTSTGEGIIVTVSVGPDTPKAPTRYSAALRRQAANRARRRQGQQELPAIAPGSCERCGGWGVEGEDRMRCVRCNGSGTP